MSRFRLVIIAKKHMHKKFFCGNATFKSKFMSHNAETLSVLIKQNKYKYNNSVLQSLITKNKMLKNELKNINNSSPESLL